MMVFRTVSARDYIGEPQPQRFSIEEFRRRLEEEPGFLECAQRLLGQPATNTTLSSEEAPPPPPDLYALIKAEQASLRAAAQDAESAVRFADNGVLLPPDLHALIRAARAAGEW